MKKLLFISILLTSINMYAQDAQIVFSTKEPIAVYLFEPLDNSYNYQYVTDTLFLKPQAIIEYKFQVTNFKFIQIKSSQFGKYVFPLTKGDTIRISCEGRNISISGSNASGLVYFNNKFIKEGLADHLEKISQEFDKAIKTMPYTQASKQCFTTVAMKPYHTLDSLTNLKQISEPFAKVLKRNLAYAFNNSIIEQYRLLLNKNKQDSIAIKSAIEDICHTCPVDAADILMYNYASNYVSNYYLMQPHSQNKDFGSYSFYLSAPLEIQQPCLGSAILVDLLYGFNSFDHKEVYSYLSTTFPKGDYVRILKPHFDSLKIKENTNKPDSIYSITDKVFKLSDLTKLKQFKDKYILIDLWATWCMPCKMEFQYATVVHQILELYPNFSLLYISIDDDRFENHWNKTIQALDLKGYHLRTNNKELYLDIQKNIYQNKEVEIPRYVLLAPTGKILSSDLPRPSGEDKMKKAVTILLQTEH